MEFIIDSKKKAEFDIVLDSIFNSINDASKVAVEQDDNTWKIDIHQTIIDKLDPIQINTLKKFTKK